MGDPSEPQATLEVKAYPRAGRERAGPVIDGVLQVRVVRPAADGEANTAIRRLVADALGTAPSRLRLVAGARGRRKRFRVAGMAQAELVARLSQLDGGPD